MVVKVAMLSAETTVPDRHRSFVPSQRRIRSAVSAGQPGRGWVSGADFPPPLEGLRRLVAANSCSRPPTRSTERSNRAIAYTVWRPCASGVTVEWVEVAGAGHAWMGSSTAPPGAGLVGKPYALFDSSAAIWSFVSAHPGR